MKGLIGYLVLGMLILGGCYQGAPMYPSPRNPVLCVEVSPPVLTAKIYTTDNKFWMHVSPSDGRKCQFWTRSVTGDHRLAVDLFTGPKTWTYAFDPSSSACWLWEIGNNPIVNHGSIGPMDCEQVRW